MKLNDILYYRSCAGRRYITNPSLLFVTRYIKVYQAITHRIAFEDLRIVLYDSDGDRELLNMNEIADVFAKKDTDSCMIVEFPVSKNDDICICIRNTHEHLLEEHEMKERWYYWPFKKT